MSGAESGPLPLQLKTQARPLQVERPTSSRCCLSAGPEVDATDDGDGGDVGDISSRCRVVCG